MATEAVETGWERRARLADDPEQLRLALRAIDLSGLRAEDLDRMLCALGLPAMEVVFDPMHIETLMLRGHGVRVSGEDTGYEDWPGLLAPNGQEGEFTDEGTLHYGDGGGLIMAGARVRHNALFCVEGIYEANR